MDRGYAVRMGLRVKHPGGGAHCWIMASEISRNGLIGVKEYVFNVREGFSGAFFCSAEYPFAGFMDNVCGLDCSQEFGVVNGNI
jgi:hypothetical protein